VAGPRRDGEVAPSGSQRIRAAGSEAIREGRSKDHFPDGRVVPGVHGGLPTGAIHVATVNNPGSRVAALRAAGPPVRGCSTRWASSRPSPI